MVRGCLRMSKGMPTTLSTTCGFFVKVNEIWVGRVISGKSIVGCDLVISSSSSSSVRVHASPKHSASISPCVQLQMASEFFLKMIRTVSRGTYTHGSVDVGALVDDGVVLASTFPLSLSLTFSTSFSFTHH